MLARCPRHIQSVFNLIVDILRNILVMVNWQLSERVSVDQCHLTLSPALVYNSLRWRAILKLSTDQLLVYVDCRLRSTMKRPYNKYLFNLVHLVITGKYQTLCLMYWPLYHSVERSDREMHILLSFIKSPWEKYAEI